MPEAAHPTTLINGGWIVAFDGERHRILLDGVVVYQGDAIIHVGKSYAGPVDHTIDARAHLVSPGLVNAHVHVGAHTGDRMIFDAGRTPVGMLYDLDFLGPEVLLGHGLNTTGHSQIAYTRRDDLALLAESGASVAHSPTVFARRGVYLESFQRYLEAGVNLAIGTDSYPQDMLGELETVALMGKIADRDFEAVNPRDVFNAAALGGARALGRDDLGRLGPGAKADILIVDFQRARVGPFLDPIKALIQCCDGEVVDTVIVAGRTRVENGQVLMWDSEELLEGVRRSCANAWDHFADYWPDDEPIEAVFPGAFESWEE